MKYVKSLCYKGYPTVQQKGWFRQNSNNTTKKQLPWQRHASNQLTHHQSDIAAWTTPLLHLFVWNIYVDKSTKYIYFVMMGPILLNILPWINKKKAVWKQTANAYVMMRYLLFIFLWHDRTEQDFIDWKFKKSWIYIHHKRIY